MRIRKLEPSLVLLGLLCSAWLCSASVIAYAAGCTTAGCNKDCILVDTYCVKTGTATESVQYDVAIVRVDTNGSITACVNGTSTATSGGNKLVGGTSYTKCQQKCAQDTTPIEGAILGIKNGTGSTAWPTTCTATE